MVNGGLWQVCQGLFFGLSGEIAGKPIQLIAGGLMGDELKS